jgi:hypothetical protein
LKLKSSQRKSLAAIPTAFRGQERRFAQSVSESLDTLSGRRGNAIDRAVTFRDLLETGVLNLSGGALSEGGVGVINPNDSDSTPNGPIELPTKPTNLTASGGFNSIFLGWVLPPYRGHDYIEIFRFATNNVVSAEAAGPYTRYYGDQYFYTDLNVGSQETWYYWVRAVNKNGIAGPFNQSAGTSATSAVDYLFVSELIDDILDNGANSLGLNASIEAIENDITTVNTTVSGLSSTVTTLNTTVNGQSTSIQTNTSTIDGIQGKFAVKIDNNGHVSGFGLISQANDHSAGFVVNPTSSFIINADRFAIARPYNSNNTNIQTRALFKVITSSTTINGAPVGAGVYIDEAFIHDAQITNALIKNATITDAKISDLTAGKITSGEIVLDSYNNNAIRQGKTSYASSVNGFWLGNLNGAGAFNLGNSTNYVRFNGSALEVTGASITDASIGTLKIANNAVTVPEGDSASISVNCGNSYVFLDSQLNYLANWDGNSVPTGLIIGAMAQYVGTNTSNQASGNATAYVKMTIEWRSNTGSYINNNDGDSTIGVSSLRKTFGGAAVSTSYIAVPSWSRGARVRIQGRNEHYSDGATTRKASKYGYFVLASKR